MYNKVTSKNETKIEITKEIKNIRQKFREFKPIRVFLAENQLTPIDVKLILRGEIDEMSKEEEIDINILYVDGAVPKMIAREGVYVYIYLITLY